MAKILETLGKTVRIINPQATPDAIAFLDRGSRVLAIGEDVSVADAANTDALMVLDTSTWDQIGPMGDVVRTTSAAKIVLDHHVSGDDLGAEVFRDEQSPATGCLVVEAADALEVTLTEKMATPLFAAIVTDTGWLRFPATTPETFRTTARLVEAGADPTSIYQTLYEQDSLSCVQLRGRALERAKTDLGGRLIYTSVRRNDLEETGATPADTEGLINLTMAVRGVEAAVLLTEQLESDSIKASFRSRGGLDCNLLARSLGGGGHRLASGATIHGDFDTVAAQVLDAVRTAMG
ncbi:MAG: bifunctional oligoribonuclease/PAP phosphatase NrnA [Pirellulales bacterium]|nr:bifunctional oligoribonuclease/PAP phosphatase NrnA [Pirellulales bacterium]